MDDKEFEEREGVLKMDVSKQSQNFDFISNPQFKYLLERDFNELNNCIEINASKSVLLLSGSIIEAILIDFFLNNLPQEKTKAKVLKMGLGELIEEAIKIELISNKIRDLSTVIKSYRNLIHPGREIRLKEEFDKDTANVAYSLVKMILKEVKNTYNLKYGYKAEDIYNKIQVDSGTYSIFDKLLDKLNKTEKNKLLKMLVNKHIETFELEKLFYDFKYINKIKQKCDDEEILVYCNELLNFVQKEKEDNILAMYEIFGGDLNHLESDEQELILTYIYSIAKSVLFLDNRLKHYRMRNIYIYFSQYFDSEILKEKFFKLLVSVVEYCEYGDEDDTHYYLTIYRNMVSEFSPDQIEKSKKYIYDKLDSDVADSFFTSLEEDDDLPF